MALPFVRGRLLGEYLSALVTTQCAHCREPLHIEVDSELKYRVTKADAKPLVFAPLSVVKKGGAQHHRLLLTEMHLLLVRRTR